MLNVDAIKVLHPVLRNIESNSWNSNGGETVVPVSIPLVFNGDDGDQDSQTEGAKKMKKHFYYVL